MKSLVFKNFICTLLIASVLSTALAQSTPQSATQYALQVPLVLQDETAIATNEVYETEEIIPEELRALKDYSIGLDELTEVNAKAAQQNLQTITFQDGDIRGFKSLTKLFAGALTLGHSEALKTTIEDMLQKLQKPGDPVIEFRFGVHAMPLSMFVIDKKAVIVDLGTLGYLKNLDELAGVIAVQMERARHYYGPKASQNGIKPKVDESFDSLLGFRDLPPEQKEHLEADIKAVDRLVKAGYNPNALYEVYKRNARVFAAGWRARFKLWWNEVWSNSPSSFEQHEPRPEVRMSTVKGYIAYLQDRQDLLSLMGKNHEFKGSMKLLQLRLMLYQFPSTSILLRRSQYIFNRLIIAATLKTGGLYLFNAIERALTAKSPEQASKILTETLANQAEKLNPYEIAQKEAVEFGMRHAPDLTTAMLPSLQSIDAALNWGNIIVALGLGAVSFAYIGTFVTTYRQGLRRDLERFHKLQYLKKWAPQISKITAALKEKKKITPDLLTRIMHLQTNALKDIEDIYLRTSDIRIFRLIDGLTLTRYRTTHGLHSLLDVAKEMWSNFDYNSQKEFWNRLEPMLSSLPAFIFENSGIRDSLRELSVLTKSIRSFDPEGSKQAFLSEKSPHEAQFEYLIRLVEMATKSSQNGPELNLKLALAFQKNKLINTSRKLYTKERELILDFALSDKNKDPQLVRDLVTMLTYQRAQKTLTPAGIIRHLTADLRVLGARLLDKAQNKIVAPHNPPPAIQKFPIVSFADNLPISKPKFLSPRYYLNESDRNAVSLYLKTNFKSVTAIKEFIDKNAVQNNAILDGYSLVFAELIVDNPKLLKTKADVEALISSEYMWPALASSRAYSGVLEHNLYDAIMEKAKKFPKTWKYEPAWAEKLHSQIVTTLKEIGDWQDTYKYKRDLL